MIDVVPKPNATPSDEVDEKLEYSDGRDRGEWKSEYPATAWKQIAFEAVFLLVLSAIAAVHLVFLAAAPSNLIGFYLGLVNIPAPDLARTEVVRLWATVFFAGILGANVFALKWLYHTVSWKLWNQDRIVWRLFVPLQGGMLAVFTGCMILAGIVPLLNSGMFARCVTAAGYGFFVGLFADNFVAALQKLAKSLLGTLGRSTA